MTLPRDTPRGERKFAVALFADLSGYTALCRRLDPEDVELTIRPLMSALQQAAVDEGGTILSVAGDGFFSIFGVPAALEDAPARALRSADAMRRAVALRNGEPGRTRVPDVHVGLACGEVLVTPSDTGGPVSIIGSAVNLASRLCDAAGGGEVLCDETCRALAADVATWDGSRNLELRGHDESVTAWVLRDSLPTAVRRDGAVPFVGRETLLGRLDAYLADVTDAQRSSVVHISGQGGIGKSRLVEHWLSLHPTVSSCWVGAYEPGVGPGILRIGELIASTTPLSGIPAKDLSDDLSRHGYRADPFPVLLAQVRRLIAQAATRNPLVVVLDDLHLADPTLRDLVESLQSDALAAPALVICLWRREELRELTPDVEVPPLEAPDVERMLEVAIGAAPPPRVRDAIVGRAEGHPLMALQSAAYLLESGVIRVDETGCELLAPGAVDDLPNSLRLFVSARLDRLPALEKSVLQELSTFGGPANENEIVRILGATATPALPDLKRRGLIRQSDGAAWTFAHGLVREVTYGTLTRKARSELHQRHLSIGTNVRSARAFHALSWVQSTSVVDRLDHETAAIAAMTESLGHARELHVSQARSAHAAIRRVRELAQDYHAHAPEVAVDLFVLDAQCLIELGQYDDALQLLVAAEGAFAEAPLGSALELRVLLVKGHALSRLRRYQGARQALDRAEAIADRRGDLSARAQAVQLSAETWRHSTHRRFTALTEEAHSLYVAAGDQTGAGECARFLATLLSTSSSSLFDRWWAAAVEATGEDDLRGQAWLSRAAALAAVARFRFADGVVAGARAIELGEQTGALDAVADGLLTCTEGALGSGDVAGASDYAEKFLTLATRVGNPRMRIMAASASIPVKLRAGDLAGAIEETMLAVEATANFGSQERLDVMLAAALVCRDRGMWSQSLAHLEECEIAASDTPFTISALGVRLTVVRIHAARGAASAKALDLDALGQDCLAAGAPLLASYAAALSELACTLDGETIEPSATSTKACPEERAIRADTAALQVELQCEDATVRWRQARDAWVLLGYSIWLARAQARCGDLDAANHTLDVLDSPAEARQWALAQPLPGGSSSSSS